MEKEQLHVCSSQPWKESDSPGVWLLLFSVLVEGVSSLALVISRDPRNVEKQT